MLTLRVAIVLKDHKNISEEDLTFVSKILRLTQHTKVYYFITNGLFRSNDISYKILQGLGVGPGSATKHWP